MIVFTALSPAFAPAQATGTVVELPVNWTVGERHRFDMIKTRQNARGRANPTVSRASTSVEIEVLEKRADGYLIQWTFGRSRLLSNHGPGTVLAERMANITAGMRLVIALDRTGSVTGLANVDEIVAHYQKASNAILGWLQEAGAGPAVVRQIKGATRQLLNPRFVSVVSLKEPSLYFLASGGRYTLNVKSEYEDALPNPFGGQPFPSKAYFLLSDLNAGRNQATVQWVQALDPMRSAPILLEAASRLAQGAGRPPPTDLEAKAFSSTISVEDQASYVFDLSDGWLISGVHRRSSRIQELRKVEQVEFKSVPR